METFVKPQGSYAGSDQIGAMEETVNTHLEQMFAHIAKKHVLDHGIGRTTAKHTTQDTRLDSQKRAYEAQTMFHAGRALELAMQVAFARGADRIMGREYPGATADEIAELDKDRRSGHGLFKLYERIVETLDGRDMKGAFEDAYQRALHDGITDILLDGNLIASFFLNPEVPFKEATIGGIADGREVTLDHSSYEDLFFPEQKPSAFSKMPYKTFEQFLRKADASYYGSRDMRWSDYTARDHEYGRPYTVIGECFFARLVKNIIVLSHQPWVWDENYAKRQFELRQRNALRLIDDLIEQNIEGDVSLPKPRPFEKTMDSLRSVGGTFTKPKNGYSSRHRKWKYETKNKP